VPTVAAETLVRIQTGSKQFQGQRKVCTQLSSELYANNQGIQMNLIYKLYKSLRFYFVFVVA
jgi:hypothetical protein